MDLLEGKSQFGRFITLDRKLTHSLNKLFKVYFAILIFVKYVDNPLYQRILKNKQYRNCFCIKPLKTPKCLMSLVKCSLDEDITCCSSGNDMNSSTDSEPELSRSSFLNRFPKRFISSASKFVAISIGKLASFPILMCIF